MTTAKRVRHPRVPEFPPLEQLAPGAPFNPNALFEAWSIRQAIARYSKLRASTKYVYFMLVDQVYVSDYDWNCQAELAGRCGLSVDQFQRHLGKLVKLRLVHVAHDIGKQNYIWLLWHPVFAGCSPLTHRTSAVGGTADVRQGVPHSSGTQRNYQRNYRGTGGATLDNATSSRGALPSDGRREGEESPAWEPLAAATHDGYFVDPHAPPPGLDEYTRAGDAGKPESLVVKRDARSFWYSFSPIEKRNRLERASSVHERVIYFRQFLQDPHADIQRQARTEVNRALAELGSMGFTLHSNGKGKP